MPHKPTTDVGDRVGKQHWCQRPHTRFVSCDDVDEALLVTVAQALGISLRRATSKNRELYWCNNRNTTISITVTQPRVTTDGEKTWDRSIVWINTGNKLHLSLCPAHPLRSIGNPKRQALKIVTFADSSRAHQNRYFNLLCLEQDWVLLRNLRRRGDAFPIPSQLV